MDKIDGFLSKGLVALKRAATEVVDEFPDNKQKAVALPETEGAVEFWSQLDLGELQERHKETLRAIQDQHSADSQAHLHNRALFAEKAYLSLTDKIINAPDPAPLLQSAAKTAVALTELEQSNAKLRQEMRSAQMDDAEVQQLLTRLRGAEKANAQLQEELEQRKQSGREAAEVQEDLADAQQRARDLAQEVALLHGRQQTWRMRCEKAQSLVFELSDARESVQAAQQQDGELTQSDLERAEAQVQDLTRERNQLQARIQALEGGSSGSAGELEALHRHVVGLQEEAVRRDEQIDALQAQLQAALSDTLQDLGERGDGNGEAAEPSTGAQLLQLEVEELRQQLAQRPSQQQHEQVLREVEMLRALTGAATDTADDAGGSSTSAADALQERGRQLSGEVAVLRSKLADAEGRAMQLQAQAQEAQQQLEQQQVQGRDLEQQLHSLTESQGKDSEGLLAAVLSQRDRYRKQIAAAEEALSTSKQQAAEAEAQVAKLNGDNVALYQKIRYLESFAVQSQARSRAQGLDDAGLPLQPSKAARYSCGPFSVGLAEASVSSWAPLGGEGMRQRLAGPRALSCFGMAEEGLPDEEAGPEARYAKAYEEQLNPFLRFQNREQEGREGSLLPHDRALLQTSRLLLTSRFSRIFVALYAVMLHVFIMLLLYYSVSPHADAVASGSSSTTGEDAIAAGASSGPVRILLLARHAWRPAL